ncbi:MAG: hypothetical protein GY751_15650 [Bacteroidetes bacterium]|nr:hypothetical protein [Bacteroidota bacterium]
MKQLFENLAYKIGEGLQAATLTKAGRRTNLFQRPVLTHESGDLSFMNGLVTTGLRGSVYLDAHRIVANFSQLMDANRQHLALVVNTDTPDSNLKSYGALNYYEHLSAVQPTGCFQLIASSAQEEIYLTLIAHRIAELSLIPGIVVADYRASAKPEIPADHLIIRYLGNPDDQIEPPTPAQKMIFGPKRRRIPNWFSLDLPVMLAPGKNSKALSLETAAITKYFHDHLQGLIEQAYSEFNILFGTDLEPVSSRRTKSKYALVSLGNRFNELMDKIPGVDKKTDVICFQQAFPFPEKSFQQLIKRKKAITVLESMHHAGVSGSPLYHFTLQAVKDSDTRIYSGKCSNQLNALSLEKAVQHMITGNSKLDYHLGLEFTRDSGNYPIHQIALQEIKKQYPGIQDSAIHVCNEDSGMTPKVQPTQIPLSIKMYKDKGPVYSRLSRFYNDTAFFYEYDKPNELVADPFAALPLAPSVSAGFISQADHRTSVPIFHTSECTGCGDCFVHCPHAALPPIAITVEQLISAGIKVAASKGIVITKLTPQLKNLAKISAKFILGEEIRSIRDFLPQAFESLITQLKTEGDKLEILQREIDAVLTEIDNLPLSVTEDFFKVPNTVEKGSGELFSLAIDPTACTGCGICADVCSENALRMEGQGPEQLESIQKVFKLWEQFPDTAGSTITRLHQDKSYSSLAAMLLSRSYYMSMNGANQSEDDAPYKTLLHIITAATESVIQPKIVQQINNIDELIDALSENIHNKLSDALPKKNLENLLGTLKQAHGKNLTLEDVVHDLEEQNSTLLDADDLERKTELTATLKTLRWSLSDGPTGVGRSRFGMLLAGSDSLEWTRQYPANNFTGPSVIHWNGSAPERSLGLFMGQLRFMLDSFKLMRKATLESKDKYNPAIHDAEIAGLEWDQLTEVEKQSIPPILLIAERDDLNESGWTGLNQLLAGKYPVKVFLLDHTASPNGNPVAALAQINSGLFSTIALKSAFVFQGGLGNTDHLFDGLLGGLSKSYPALFSLYATKQIKHGIHNTDWTPHATLALNSRAFPALRYDPGEKSDYISGAISLEGNKASHQNWVKENILLDTGESVEYTITWADWALTQVDWKDQFMPLESKSKKLLLSEYIQLGAQGRKNHRPAIMRADNQGLKYYSVSPLIVEMTETVLAYWRTLQEMSGLLTEFPLKLRTEITKELSVQYEKDAATLKEQFEKKIKDQQAVQNENLRQQLKEKLVALASMAKKQSEA